MTGKLLDDDGENRAVRAFLMAYGTPGLSCGEMQRHMKNCGFPFWPDWVWQQEGHGLHLTKAGAQDWLRHLFALEAATIPADVGRRAMEALEDALEELYRVSPSQASPKVRAAITELQQALAAPSGGQE